MSEFGEIWTPLPSRLDVGRYLYAARVELLIAADGLDAAATIRDESADRALASAGARGEVIKVIALGPEHLNRGELR